MPKYCEKEERKNQIFALFERDNTPKTVYRIAKSLNMANSTHVRNLTMELVSEGTLIFYEVDHRPNRKKRLYQLNLKGKLSCDKPSNFS